MNEGWASFWHARIMRELDLSDNEHIEFAELHSGVVSPQKGQLNPYYLGYKIFEDIEKRWDNPSQEERDRKSTRLNSSHANISYAVFCLKKKKTHKNSIPIMHHTA